ncbi:hypothetical protein OKW21_001080 [Catalinimonas alkaloidigena]|nr:hypothetical protein [Catalinimonas alkaloidigena]
MIEQFMKTPPTTASLGLAVSCGLPYSHAHHKQENNSGWFIGVASFTTLYYLDVCR